MYDKNSAAHNGSAKIATSLKHINGVKNAMDMGAKAAKARENKAQDSRAPLTKQPK